MRVGEKGCESGGREVGERGGESGSVRVWEWVERWVRVERDGKRERGV